MQSTDAAALERLRLLIIELDAKLHEAEEDPADVDVRGEVAVRVSELAILSVPPRLKAGIAEPLISAVAIAQILARRIDDTYTHPRPSSAILADVELWIGRLRGGLALVDREVVTELGKEGP